MQFTYRTKTFDIVGLSPNEHIYKIINKTKCFYERDLLEYMLTILGNVEKPNTIAIDVGANIGNHSIFMRSFLTNNLIAIEPNTTILPILRRNLAQNINHYSVYEVAAGESEALGTIDMPEKALDNQGMAKVVVGGSQGTIRITTIDSIVAQWKNKQDHHCYVAIIKIDVEGMELPALKGAVETIDGDKPHIFVEAATTKEFEVICDFLREMGYKKLSKLAGTPVYHFAHHPRFTLVLQARQSEIFHKLLHTSRLIRFRLNEAAHLFLQKIFPRFIR